jgi:hypothetical protein
MKRIFFAVFLVIVGLLSAQVNWHQLIDEEGSAGEEFGHSVAMKGNFAAVGAPNDNNFVGSVLVFHFDGEEWNEFYRIVPADGASGDNFGRSLVMDDDFIVVGAPGADDDLGAVYFYQREDVEWIEVNRCVPFDTLGTKGLGVSLAMEDDMVLAGAISEDFNVENSGAVYAYQRAGNNWEEAGIITASDGEENDFFGCSVDLTKNGSEYKAIIGARFNNNIGSAYIFSYCYGDWNQQSKIVGSANQNHENFGQSVTIDGNKAVISTRFSNSPSSSVFTYSYSILGWEELTSLNCVDSDSFGCRLALKGDYLVVSDNNGSAVWDIRGGEIFLYKLFDDQWGLLTSVEAYDGEGTDRFGSSICIDESNVIVGAYGHNSLGARTGASYIYEFSDYIEITDSENDQIEQAQHSISNYPNPFNPRTTIAYTLAEEANIDIQICNIKGQKVKTLVTGTKSSGQYEATWDGKDDNSSAVSSGIYYAILKSEEQVLGCRKMILLK